MDDIEHKAEEVEMADGTKIMVSNKVGSHTYLSESAFEEIKDKYREMTMEHIKDER